MNLLLIATVSLFFVGASPFPQAETTVKPENGVEVDNKSLNETQPEVPPQLSDVNGTALPPPPPSPLPAENGKKPEPEFGPEARSDSPRGRPKISFKGKPLSKPFSKAQRKKLTEVQKKPFNPLPAARRKRPVAPVPAAKVSKSPPKPVERVPPPKPAERVSKPKPVERVDKAQRRDHSPSYGLPPVFGNEVIIKQAGPSQEYGWVGHGRNGPLNLPNPFPASLPKWILENNKIFEAGLLYPGPPSSAPSYAPPPPPPPSQPVYEPAPAEPVYSEPTSYNVPQIPISSSYNNVEQQPAYNEAPQSYVVPEVPLSTYGDVSPSAYNEVQQAPTNYGIVPAGANYGSAVVSASYSSVDTAQGNYQAPNEYAAAVPATYAEPFSGYVPAPQQESYIAPTDFRAAAPFPSYGASSPEAPLNTYDNVAPPLNVYDAPVLAVTPAYDVPAAYGAPQAVESYEAPAAYGVPQTVETYEAPATYGAPQAVESYEAPANYGVQQTVESYEAPAAYGAPEEAPAPLPTYNAQPVPVDYNVPAPDDQSLYNLYKSPVQQQPSYQEVADNSYNVPSVSRPGNFPAYNEELAQPLDTQDIYDVPIKVEETYQNQGDSKTPEVFYIFYENQEPTAAAQNEQGYVVAPPENSGFVPPKDIQTIYVPAENAINVPQNFGVDVGSSFGYSSPDSVIPEYDDIQPSTNGFSFDSPAFNAPPRPITETLFRGSVENGLKDPIIKDDVQNPLQPRNPLRPIRQLLKKPLPASSEDLSLESLSLLKDESLPYGTRLRVSQD